MRGPNELATERRKRVESNKVRGDSSCTNNLSKSNVNSTVPLYTDNNTLLRNVTDGLKNGEFWSKYEIVLSPGDGHCIMHSIYKCLNAHSHNEPASNVTMLLEKLRIETIKNAHKYINYIDGSGTPALLDGLDKYIYNKVYDSSYGDLVPIIMANALLIDIIIVIDDNNIITTEFTNCTGGEIKNDTRTLMLHKKGNYYNAIVPINEDETNAKTHNTKQGESLKNIYYDLKCALNHISSLSIGMLNVRSLLHTIEEIRLVAQFDIFCINET